MSNFTSILARHFNSQHTLFDPKIYAVEEPADDQTDIRERFKRAKTTGKEFLAKPFNNSFKALLLEWIIRINVAFTAVENQQFRSFLRLLINQADDLLPKTSNTIKNWVIQEFKEHKNGIKTYLLTHAKGRIHLSFDL